MLQQAQFGEIPQVPKERIFVLEVPGRMPSWNEILGMEEWARYKYKQQVQENFLSALRVSAQDCSTKTTCAKNIWSIAADILASYRAMVLAKRKLKQSRKKQSRAALSLFESKSSKGKVPF